MTDSAGSTAEPAAADSLMPSGASASSEAPKILVMPNGEAVTAPPTEFMGMQVLVTFVGGPADRRTERLPLSRLKETITIDGVGYKTRSGIPPELKETDQGKAQVFRPVG